MFHTIECLVLLVFYAIIRQANGQADCVPLSVENIDIRGDATLYWSVSPDESCVIDHFIVNIQFTFGEIESTLVTETPSVNISFLPPCEDWIFSVSAVSADHVAGGVHNLFAKVPMAPGTDLTVRFVNVEYGEEYVTLRWEIANASNANCADSYRLTTVDVAANTVTDRELVGNFAFVWDLSPCSVYQFGVRAIHRALPDQEGPLTSFPYADPPKRLNPPTLLSIDHGSTYFNSTWLTEDYSSNSCDVTAIYVDGSPYFNLTIPVEDSPQRGPISVYVNSLQPSAFYIFRISVENTGGRSDPVAVAVQTLPAGKEETKDEQ